MRRCVIVGGAEIRDYAAVRAYLREDDYCIFCDCGLRHREGLGIEPDLIVGDFDSHECPDTDTETIVLPREKDDTDTVFAAKEALRRSFVDFLLVGVIGGRLDHTLGNVAILLLLRERGGRGRIVDDFSEMELVAESSVNVEDRFAYFSLLNISGTARGVTVEGAKYPLRDAEISCGYPYGISNEVLSGRRAVISVREGELLLIRLRR
ncbi:MAG: thiamine diphosphokinase [Oscillospiraceae bacterium]|nr:thiamine diphosphokinase [Oscillospiraceae bacterium]